MKETLQQKVVEILNGSAQERETTVRVVDEKLNQMRAEVLQTSQNLVLEHISKMPNIQPNIIPGILRDYQLTSKSFVDQQVTNLSRLIQALNLRMNANESRFVQSSEMEKAIKMIFQKCEAIGSSTPVAPFVLGGDPLFLALQGQVGFLSGELAKRDQKIHELEGLVKGLSKAMAARPPPAPLPPTTPIPEPLRAASLNGVMGGGEVGFDLAPLSDEPPIHVGVSAESFFDLVPDPPIPTRVIAAVTNGGGGIASEPLNPLMQQILRTPPSPSLMAKRKILGIGSGNFSKCA